MFFQIEKLILWPKKNGLAPRIVKFEKNKLNLITGASKTGKSAIIPIMDYCLCASKCAIPTGIIRDKTDWYGLVICIGNKKILIAREEPESRRASTQMYIKEGDSISIPDIIKSNTNIDNVKLFLNNLSGLTNLDFDIHKNGSPARRKPSFRDLVSFNFQPQNIIANPNALLYRTDSTEQKEKLKVMLWYVLGAVSADILFLFHQRQLIRNEIKRLNSDIKSKLLSLNKWHGDVNGFTQKAIELGLLNKNVLDHDIEGKISTLSKITAENNIIISANEINKSINIVTKLEKEEISISNDIMKIKSRLRNMAEIKDAINSRNKSNKIVRDRLLVSSWLESLLESEKTYMSHLKEFRDEIIEPLLVGLKSTESESVETPLVSDAFNRENIRLQEELSISIEMLNKIKKEIKILKSNKNNGFDNARINQFVGMIRYAIKNIETPDNNNELKVKLDSLLLEEKKLDLHIKNESVERKKKLSLEKISDYITSWLPKLDNERPYDKVGFDDKELTLRIVGNGRDDYLWEIGSGANWVSYHIASLLGMHDFFLSQEKSPVPSFIAFDQPSQAYFPRGNLIDGIDNIKDEDIESVKKTFLALSESTISKNIQIIVLDHIPKELMSDLSNSFLVEEWRDGNKLIPENWV
ncbi:DUF3732 domain-containing protein [Serratia proteamaculans]|uniref:DUF3732 domain-containing protein n=1 Tax=Serratia proteamaculans TaxID=28151 RepID=UPI00217719AE|nr:DUF3732 domain-containing protein [Serratia proteamaculans]CAI0900444.1 Protein of uncharacterised function (DUF3732) [Serratia proteamaculans]CAI2088668.1 Protein of uncharacterised function (DUF3732) [Serratia proteamaculans]